MAKPALGRGLGALLGGNSPAVKPLPTAVPGAEAPPSPRGEHVQQVPLIQVRPSALQPRKDFAPESLQELADSIKEQGIVQPLIVRRTGEHYELIAGERRWRAAQMAGLTQVPVLVREADDRALLELALIENLQRENLNPIEEAVGYGQLIEQFQLRQEDVAAKVGKSRAVVANALRLLKLPGELQSWVRDGRLSVGHAKVILALNTPDTQRLAAERVLKAGLNVRQTEELVTHLMTPRAAASNHARNTQASLTGRDPHVAAMEEQLQQRLGTKVSLRYRQGKGALEIRFFSDAELERILQVLGIESE